jgi:hypothetical protein
MQLINLLKNDFQDIKFKESGDFCWDPNSRTVFYNSAKTCPHSALLLLHELAHAVLGHQNHSLDVELIRLEADAWNHVKTILSPKYSVDFDENLVNNHMDSYRNWLFRRSVCPECSCHGWQLDNNRYRCPQCLSVWLVNSDKFKNTYRKVIHQIK